MLKNYFKVALRNIRKHKFYSAINILGLAAGVTSCLFIILYISDELSYDKFHAGAENIYRIGLEGKIGDQEIRTASSCPPLASAMAKEIPGVESSIRVSPRGNSVFKYEDKSFTEEQIVYTDSNFFEFFSFRLIEGDPATALKEPNSIVLTERIAKKYFDKGSAIGKLITVGNDNRTFKVTGIAEEPPFNSHFRFGSLLSTSSQKDYYDNGIWLNNSLYTYFRKTPATSVESVNAKLEELVVKYTAPQIEQFIGITIQKFKEQGNKYSYVSYPMLDSHLHSTWNDEITPTNDIAYVYVFGAAGIFILIIACINFMNLSTARSAGRAKEVGLRKTLGSFRGQMVSQFLAESTVYGLLAVILAIGACYALMPQFNLLAGKQLTFASLWSTEFITGGVVLVLLIGLLAGSYPAFYLTSFSAVEVLKGKVRAGMRSKGIRSGLVVFQFALSIVLIICTVVGYQQIDYLQSRHMGLDKHNVLVVSNTGRLNTNQEAFKNSLLEKTGIEKASFTNNVFPGVNNTTAFRTAGDGKDHIMGTYYADYDHLDVMKFELTEGRFFSKDFPSDSSAAIINEAAAREAGWPTAVGEELIAFNGPNNQEQRLKVVGVVKDFNFESFKTDVRPMVIRLTRTSGNLLIRYSGSPEVVLKDAETLWKQYASGDPFEYSFLDQNFDELFRDEQRLSGLFWVVTSLAIFIACLGLFALAAFTAEQRTKEIGIRKAMGASVFGITALLSKEFTILVIVSVVLAIAPAWLLLNFWLEQFAYHIDVSVLVFVFSGLAALIIAWLTVAFHAIKAALAKPVNSLRYE
jgi:putative ABC transport system permease protein